MSEVYYAIEINTGVAVNVAQLGHTNDGYMRLITGRPGYDGNPTYPTWEDTSNNTDVWYEGIIAKNGISAPNRMIDIKTGGNYASVSGMTVSLSNFNTLWDYLNDNDIYLINRPISLYVVIDDVFYSAWVGVVTDHSYDETIFKVTCDSNYRKIHKTIPPNVINKALYPDSTIDDTIPVVIGNVSYAKIFGTGMSDTKYIVDYDIENNAIYRCSFNTYVANDYITLLTLKKPYIAGELTGKFIRTVSGTDAELTRVIQITGNDASTTGSAGTIANYYQTRIYISESFEANQATVNGYSYTWLDTETTIADIWWFEILDAKTEAIVSNESVDQILTDDFGQTILNYYNDDTDQMIDVHGLVTGLGTSKNRDSISLVRTAGNINGEINFVTNRGVSVLTVDATTAADVYEPFDYITVGNSLNMSDIDRSTETDNILSSNIHVDAADHPDTPVRFENVVFDVDVNDFDLRDSDSIAIGFDLELTVDPHLSATVPFDVGVGWDFRLIDSYGRVMILTDDMGVNYTYEQQCAAYPVPTTLDFNFLPNDYYRLGEDNSESSLFGLADNDSNAVRDYLILPDELTDAIKAGNVMRIRVTLNVSSYSNCQISDLKIKQIGVFDYKLLETDKDKLFLKIFGGEKYDVSTDTKDCYNAFQHILENYDGISSSDIDYGNLATTRTVSEGWLLGNQITKQKNSFDYLRDLCRFYFVGMFQDRSGNLKLSAFKEDTVSTVADFDQTNIIRDSIKTMGKSTLLNVYNEFILRWGYNGGSEKYDKAISISGVDILSTFPDFLTDDTGYAGFHVTSPNVTSFDYYDNGYGIIVFDASIAATLFVDDSITIYLTSGGVETSKFIYYAKITKVDSDTVYFDSPLIQTTTASFELGITNTSIYKHASNSNAPQWMTLVQGIKEYAVAKSIWDACQASYEKTNVVKAYPDLESDWFIDEETFYSLNDMYYGTSPILFLQNFIDWVTVQKDIVKFQIPITAANVALNLLDYVSFTDTIITLDVARYGWIIGTKINANRNTIELELILLPNGYTESGDIIETGSATDEIEETGSATDEIEEG